MVSSYEPGDTPLEQAWYVVLGYAVLGVAVGLAAAVAIARLGASGGPPVPTLVLVWLVLVGPVVALFAAYRSADRLGGNLPAYLAGVVGGAAGFVVFLGIVSGLVSLGVPLLGGSSEGAFLTLLAESPAVPVAGAVAAGVAGLGGAYVGGETGVGRELEYSRQDLPVRTLAGVAALLVLGVGIMAAGTGLPGDVMPGPDVGSDAPPPTATETPRSSVQTTDESAVQTTAGTQTTAASTQETSNTPEPAVRPLQSETDIVVNETGIYGVVGLLNDGSAGSALLTGAIRFDNDSVTDITSFRQVELDAGERRTATVRIVEFQNGDVVGASRAQTREMDAARFEMELILNGRTFYAEQPQ